MKTLSSTELKRLHRQWRRRTQGRLALLLDGVQTPYNVGSILRTAAAYRVDHLWLVDPTESPDHPKTQKTALGSQRFLTFTRSASVEAAVTEVHQARYQLVGIELADDAVPLHELTLAADVCLAVGHEDRGLVTRRAGGLRRRGLPAPARRHRVAQRGPGRLDRPLRGPSPRVDAQPAP